MGTPSISPTSGSWTSADGQGRTRGGGSPETACCRRMSTRSSSMPVISAPAPFATSPRRSRSLPGSWSVGLSGTKGCRDRTSTTSRSRFAGRPTSGDLGSQGLDLPSHGTHRGLRLHRRPRTLPHSSRIRPANDREESRNDGNCRATECAGHSADSSVPPGSSSGLWDTLKVETRVRTPLGLPAETRHRQSRLHPCQGADMGSGARHQWRWGALGGPGCTSLVPHSSRSRRDDAAAGRSRALRFGPTSRRTRRRR